MLQNGSILKQIIMDCAARQRTGVIPAPAPRRSPPSGGRRLGVPAIGGWIDRVLQDPSDRQAIAAVRAEVLDLCRRHPIY
jgi:hypothetical protein